MHWTVDQILALAPDPNTAKRGQGLATQRKWLSLETDGRAVWGQCKSSGSAHYETAVDLKGPAFRCNCPSRKFPCKHAIGLLLLAYAADTDGFRVAAEMPEAVQTWIEKRDNKSGQPQKERTEEEIKKSEERKAKTFNARMDSMQEGIKDLENWLQDLIRVGLASVESSASDMMTVRRSTKAHNSSEFWNTIAKRMVDAKLSGLGRRIRELSLIQGATPDWPARILAELSDLYLVVKGFEKLEELPEKLQKEILSLSGINTPKDELLSQKGIEDEWMVVGQFEGMNIDHAAVRRTWFLGQETGKYALVLEYDYRNEGFPFHWPKGRVFKGEMLFYPSIFPMRAIMRNHQITEHAVDGWGGCENMEEFLADYAKTLGQNPWLVDYPIAFTNVYPQMNDGVLYLVDENQKGIPLLNVGSSNWKILALSGGNPIEVFGEWTGEVLNPLGIVADYRYVGL